MPDQLCTVAQVKARLGITDAADDAAIGEAIEEVTDEIQQFTGRRFLPEPATTYVFDTVAGHALSIPRGIRAVTAMGVASTSQPDTGGTYQAVTLSTILLRPASGNRRPGWPATELRLSSSPISSAIPFRTVANGATVTGDFGWSAVPPAIIRVAITGAVAEFLDRRRAGQAGPEGVELPALLEATDLAVLARFRDLGIA